MGRPRNFNQTEVTQAAMRVFWQKGYDGTSIPDLLEATGLSRSSLYESFGDKASLFEVVTYFYLEQYGARQAMVLREAMTAKEGLTKFFKLQINASLSSDNPPGCLLTNTATSLKSHEPRIAKLLNASTHGLWIEFKNLLSRAQAAGEIRQERNIEAMAHMLVNVAMGMNVMIRVNPQYASLEAMAASAVESIN
jgi:TetR/AcrR family transcriptional repressor of nem operon